MMRSIHSLRRSIWRSVNQITMGKLMVVLVLNAVVVLALYLAQPKSEEIALPPELEYLR